MKKNIYIGKNEDEKDHFFFKKVYSIDIVNFHEFEEKLSNECVTFEVFSWIFSKRS